MLITETQLSSEEKQPSPILLQAAKSALLCLHHIWESDEKSFIKALSAIPKIQRRYVWSINHLLNLTEAKHIKLEFGKTHGKLLLTIKNYSLHASTTFG